VNHVPAVKSSMGSNLETSVLAESIVVRPVQSRREREQFVRLPWRIYRDDPQWVPPLMVDVKQFINRRKHAFYRHGDAQLLLAWRGREVVGRIMVSDDPRYHEIHADNIGCFGMFESIDDPAVAHALLDAASQWLAAKGRTAIRGPIDYSLSYPAGLLFQGFDTPPRVMMNHHPRYYSRWPPNCGCSPCRN
jgi:hypothetical protein